MSARLAPADLAAWLGDQRWFARDGAAVAVTDVASVPLPTRPAISLAVATTDLGERYQLVRRDDAPDRAAEPRTATALASFVAAGGEATGPDGATVRARWLADAPPGRATARPLGAEQSNTSVAVGGTHMLKVLRRLHTGSHPEVEVGRHLRRSPGAPVAALAGWYELVAADGATTVLGVVHDLVAGALDGWALVRSALAADPGGVLGRLRDLGVATAELHRALAVAGDDPSFGTEPLDGTALWSLADRLHADPTLGEAGHHAVAHALDGIGADAGAAIRTHGDLHLGQTMVGADGWVIFDFEGEPSRPLAERGGRTSPLRDVAGLLRSLAYVRATHELDGNRPVSAGWEAAARAAVLDGYLATIDPDLLPTSAASTRHLLTLFELEKLAYEVAYERAHRPDWEVVPRSGLDALVARVGP